MNDFGLTNGAMRADAADRAGGRSEIVGIVAKDRDGAQRNVAARAGTSMMEALRDGGFDIAAICGGCCSCATCHVYVDPAAMADLAPPAELERELIEGLMSARANSRLSCQLTITAQMEGLRVEVAPEE